MSGSPYKQLILPAIGLLVVGGYWIWRSTVPDPPPAAASTNETKRADAPGATSSAGGPSSGAKPGSTSPPVNAPSTAVQKTRRDREATNAIREQLRQAARASSQARGGASGGSGSGQAAAEPKLDAAYIQARVREDLLPIAQECYETALETQPKLAGKLVMKFAIVGDPSVGGVVDEAMEDPTTEIRDPDLLECMRESMMSLAFPPPEDGGRIDVTYPFVFAPDEPAAK